MAKYGNRKVEADGIVFDSAREAARYKELKLAERAGAIRDLQRQVEFLLIPAQYENLGETGKRRGKCLERACKYIADFVYTVEEKAILPGHRKFVMVVEDAKGVRTEGYKIKKKLMLQKYGIQIREV